MPCMTNSAWQIKLADGGLPDHDAVRNGLDDLPALRKRKRAPAAGEVPRVGQRGLAGKDADTQHVEVGLEARQLLFVVNWPMADGSNTQPLAIRLLSAEYAARRSPSGKSIFAAVSVEPLGQRTASDVVRVAGS